MYGMMHIDAAVAVMFYTMGATSTTPPDAANLNIFGTRLIACGVLIIEVYVCTHM